MDAEDWNRRYAAADLVWSAEPNRFVAAALDGLPPGRALDLASGEGRNALWLAGKGWRVTAIDYAQIAVDKGRERARQDRLDVDWTVGDVLAYLPPAEGFDLVLIAYLHLPPGQMAQVWALATRAVAPGGTLFAIGHDRTNPTHGTGGPQDPDLLWVPEELTRTLVADGLTVDRAERVQREVATDEGPRQAVDTLLQAHAPVPDLP
ncbi:class I SAM-dependent methyltransferase [Catellatospora sichuanensis]|uniref:class I SAM-dependent methyltransferase n=1 Tax=Catellatospora sichuanensis TaxID=1969805 RepID=UPI001182CC07|nr:class I SAM-dependent methyltransferase [Catellatospora sichuanensis]